MDIVNFPDGFRPNGSDFLLREQKKATEFERLRQQLGRGIVDGLTLARQSDGSVVLAAGHGNDANGNAIVVAQSAALDLRSVNLPASGKFRFVAVCLEYRQEDSGQASGVADAWAEKIDSYIVTFIEGDEADSEAAALRPENRSTSLRVGDILYGDNGTRSVSATNAEYLNGSGQSLGVDINLSGVSGTRFREYLASEKLATLWQDLPEVFGALSEYWVEGSDYVASQVKFHNGKQYICTAPHTATAANAPGASGAPWEEYNIHLLKLIYPIGSIYANAAETENPSVYLGFGVWAAIPAGHAVAALGDDLTLGKTVTDQFQGHRHQTHWHGTDDLSGGGSSRPRNPYSDVNGGSIYELGPYGAPRVGKVTRGKRFGANIWRRVA